MRSMNKLITFGILATYCLLFGWEKSDAAKCPCDIYEEGGTPCVAAHSTTRALYSSYNGPLYQVRRTSDGKTLDIGLLSPGGIANAAMQDTFLNSKAGTISKIYDQSQKKNDLVKAPIGGFLHNGGLEASATAAKKMLNGHNVYGVYTTSSWDNEVGSVGYRNNQTTGVATGNQPEGIYMVCDGKRFNEWCCFDYGNAQTDNTADAQAIMETVYFGNSIQWGHGAGDGPWVMADLEWGLFAGGALVNNDNTPIIADYISGMVKGDSTNLYAIRGGSAQSGSLKTMYSGKRPSGYYPMKKEGAIVLGIGGDNSHTGMGTFFEGAITRGYPSDATEDAVQANIVAAGYGSAITSSRHTMRSRVSAPVAKVYCEVSGRSVKFRIAMPGIEHLNIEILDQSGRKITTLTDGSSSSGMFNTVWNANRLPAGMYIWRAMSVRGELANGKVIVQK